ncbi:MAG: hypothetical protein Aurels2KO_30340 [Aureliella sp.]
MCTGTGTITGTIMGTITNTINTMMTTRPVKTQRTAVAISMTVVILTVAMKGIVASLPWSEQTI